MIKRPVFVLAFLALAVVASGQQTKALSAAQQKLLETPDLLSAQVGLLVVDDSTKQTVAAYQDNKYFTPASNTKLFSLYAGMKYLGDSLPGIDYLETDTALFIYPTGDPTLLDPLYESQPVMDFLRAVQKKIYVVPVRWEEDGPGKGWSTDDFSEDFSAERSPLPVYANTIRWVQQFDPSQQKAAGLEVTPVVYSIPEINWPLTFATSTDQKIFSVRRDRNQNVFTVTLSKERDAAVNVPFLTDTLRAAIQLIGDSLKRPLQLATRWPPQTTGIGTIFSRPADSLYVPMMYESINLDAEQILLMSSNRTLGLMSDEKIIKKLLETSLVDLPQKPVWADGSGTSRYNLFSPQDMVMVLDKMKNEFGIERMKRILPSGGQGTFRNYYQAEAGRIFAKTGSMSGVFCISGYLYSAKKHLLLFSIMTNHSNGSGSAIRRAIEKYVEEVAKRN